MLILPSPGNDAPITRENTEPACIPCTGNRLKYEFLAYSSSKCTGFGSPINCTKAVTSCLLNITFSVVVSPTLNIILQFYYSIFLAGFPITTVPSLTFLITTLPAPTTDLSPILFLGYKVVLV